MIEQSVHLLDTKSHDSISSDDKNVTNGSSYLTDSSSNETKSEKAHSTHINVDENYLEDSKIHWELKNYEQKRRNIVDKHVQDRFSKFQHQLDSISPKLKENSPKSKDETQMLIEHFKKMNICRQKLDEYAENLLNSSEESNHLNSPISVRSKLKKIKECQQKGQHVSNFVLPSEDVSIQGVSFFTEKSEPAHPIEPFSEPQFEQTGFDSTNLDKNNNDEEQNKQRLAQIESEQNELKIKNRLKEYKTEVNRLSLQCLSHFTESESKRSSLPSSFLDEYKKCKSVLRNIEQNIEKCLLESSDELPKFDELISTANQIVSKFVNLKPVEEDAEMDSSSVSSDFLTKPSSSEVKIKQNSLEHVYIKSQKKLLELDSKSKMFSENPQFKSKINPLRLFVRTLINTITFQDLDSMKDRTEKLSRLFAGETVVQKGQKFSCQESDCSLYFVMNIAAKLFLVSMNSVPGLCLISPSFNRSRRMQLYTRMY